MWIKIGIKTNIRFPKKTLYPTFSFGIQKLSATDEGTLIQIWLWADEKAIELCL